MKKNIILFLLILTTTLIAIPQCKIIIRYTDPNIRISLKMSSYRFSTVNIANSELIKEFEVLDSLSCMFLKQKIDSIKLCLKKSKRCYFPDVRQQITVIFNEEYDTLFSDGCFAMEKNGKPIIFDEILQEAINKAIEDYEQKLPENERLHSNSVLHSANNTYKKKQFFKLGHRKR